MPWDPKNLTYNNPHLPEGVPDTPCYSGVGKGWWPVIKATHEMMLRIVPDYQLDQVKEKFGGLRYYWGMPMPDFYPDRGLTPEEETERTLKYEQLTVLADLAEAICNHLCEECGRANEISWDGGWARNVCESCVAEFQAKREALDAC